MDGSGARRRTIATALTLAVALVALALPGAAAAQSAGDDQYADPLAGDRPSQAPQGGDDQPSAPTPTPAPAPAPAPSSPSGETAGTAPDAPATTTSTDGGRLPRTGADPAPLAAAGLLLLLAGVPLRRRMQLRAGP